MYRYRQLDYVDKTSTGILTTFILSFVMQEISYAQLLCNFEFLQVFWVSLLTSVQGYQASRLGKTSQEPPAPPNNILFIQNLPAETTSMMLQILFQQYPGFREVRMIEAKPGIAFVEYEDDSQSMVAMQALQGFKITPYNPMAISYAKKWMIHGIPQSGKKTSVPVRLSALSFQTAVSVF